MKFLIDDERLFLPDTSVPDMIARTFLAGGIVLGLATEKDEIWVDHDLGEEDMDRTGYRLLTNYEEYLAVDPSHCTSVPRFHLVTGNPVGRYRMKQAIASIERLAGRAEPLPPPKPEPPKSPKPPKPVYRTAPPSTESRFARERSAAPWRRGGTG